MSFAGLYLLGFRIFILFGALSWWSEEPEIVRNKNSINNTTQILIVLWITQKSLNCNSAYTYKKSENELRYDMKVRLSSSADFCYFLCEYRINKEIKQTITIARSL